MQLNLQSTQIVGLMSMDKALSSKTFTRCSGVALVTSGLLLHKSSGNLSSLAML
jgi:hypothetical protein